MACWLLVGSRTRTRRALPRLLSRGQELADQGSPGLLGTNRAAVHWGVRFPRSSARWTRAIRGGVGTDESQGWDESLAGQGADSWHAVGD